MFLRAPCTSCVCRTTPLPRLYNDKESLWFYFALELRSFLIVAGTQQRGALLNQGISGRNRISCLTQTFCNRSGVSASVDCWCLTHKVVDLAHLFSCSSCNLDNIYREHSTATGCEAGDDEDSASAYSPGSSAACSGGDSAMALFCLLSEPLCFKLRLFVQLKSIMLTSRCFRM